MSSSPSRRPRLVGRVALVGAVAAAVGGGLAAVVSGVVAGRLVADHEDDGVLAEAHELADEVAEEIYDRDPDDVDDDDDDFVLDADGRPTPASVLAHELVDVKRTGARAAIVEGERVIAGDPALADSASLALETCATSGEAEAARRACVVPLGDGSVIVLEVDGGDERERRDLIVWALVLGALVAATVGGGLSHRSATWAMAPITALRERVRAIDPAAPRAGALEPPATHAEVEELRRAVADLVGSLGDALAVAQSFSARAAHELRTPLSVLAGELELLLEGPPDRTPEEVRALHHLQRLVEDLISLTQRLLVLATPGRNPAEAGEPVDLSDVVEAITTGLSAADAARVRVHADDDVIVRGDFELLRSMVHNAIGNALKFSAGPIDVRIRGDAAATIEVADDGPGIPAAAREAVFRPFHRGEGARRADVAGHGVGLALIAHVAAAHGGDARFTDVERGACLQLALPRWRSSGPSLHDHPRAGEGREA